jgi:uncharacterized Zn-binding protein involved in type VI secretion
MATGTDSFWGKAMPILGNTTLTGETVADDILTITSPASQTGDFFVCENSTGTEHLVLSSSGVLTVQGVQGAAGAAATIALSGMSGSATSGITITVTSTAAVDAGVNSQGNAILVQPNSKAAFHCVVMYDGVGGATTTAESDCTAFLGNHGTKAPTYFLTIGGTGDPGEGAATDNGFLDAALTLNSANTKLSYAGLKCMFGSKAYYILACPDTNLA